MLENEVKRLVVKMHPEDNVLVALTDLAKGENVVFEEETYILQDTIKAKHKFYTTDLSWVMKSLCMVFWLEKCRMMLQKEA